MFNAVVQRGQVNFFDFQSGGAASFGGTSVMLSFGRGDDVVLQDAFEVAQTFLNAVIRPVHGPDVVICSCNEFPNAWVFGYNTRRFLVEMELTASLIGNGPVVVPKSGGAPFLGASGRPIEDQIEGLE